MLGLRLPELSTRKPLARHSLGISRQLNVSSGAPTPCTPKWSHIGIANLADKVDEPLHVWQTVIAVSRGIGLAPASRVTFHVLWTALTWLRCVGFRLEVYEDAESGRRRG